MTEYCSCCSSRLTDNQAIGPTLSFSHHVIHTIVHLHVYTINISPRATCLDSIIKVVLLCVCLKKVFTYGLIFILSVRPSLCIMVYNATNVSCVCRWRDRKGLGGLSAFKQRWVIMADSTTGYGVINSLPAGVGGHQEAHSRPVSSVSTFILVVHQLYR